MSLGVSGRIAAAFLTSAITPLIAVTGLLLGAFALMVTPREEEPQIDVTFANVFIPYPGATASEVEHLVSTPAEQVLSELLGVKHVYSMSRPGLSVITVEFEVGEPRMNAILQLYNAVFSNQDWLPENLGVGQAIVKPMGIDDVPILSLTFWSEASGWTGQELQKIAHTVETELKRVDGTRDIYTVGAAQETVSVLIDPQRLAAYDMGLSELARALQAANFSREAGEFVRAGEEITVTAGTFLSRPDEVANLVVGVRNGGPIFLSDVADVKRTAEPADRYSWLATGPQAVAKGVTVQGMFPSVTVAVAKKPGFNAVDIADTVLARVEQLRGVVIPADVHVTVTRNYGATAQDKAQTLMTKLIFATASVIVLVGVFLGIREAVIVGAAVIITLVVTLFASWAVGFTLNRVSLFALIFSIGILVDDAIVVVENVHRHLQRGAANMKEAIIAAVDEVGGPTILATFTVIAALLPMAFVSGLMGPYMSPIPINASMGMLISLAIAFVITPWMANRLLHAGHVHAQAEGGAVSRGFNTALRPFLGHAHGRRNRWLMLAVVFGLIGVAVSLPVAKLVVLKMLPFDNKSEFQVVIDMPEGTPLERTQEATRALADYLVTVPEVTDVQAYVGTASPINFNGLVRQYYLRDGSNVADVQVNLVDKADRDRKSHDIARAVRPELHAIADGYGAVVKVVEVPPGPPVIAPLVAEIYGMDYAEQAKLAGLVKAAFAKAPEVVDLDDSLEFPAERLVIAVDRERAARLGIDQATIVNAVATLVGGQDVTYLRDPGRKYAVPIRLRMSEANKTDINVWLDLKLADAAGGPVFLRDVVRVEQAQREPAIIHKDLVPVVMVTGDAAGDTDSPLYSMFQISNRLKDEGSSLKQYFISAPQDRYSYSLKWDGEWTITYETFRDMGMAYGVGIILIYLLVVGQFRSYVVPLIIMAPIPLTIIGVMPAHAVLGAPFTATSMIGMIALAGIIVRNSILLVDFINEEVAEGAALEQAVLQSSAVRAKPIVLTAVAAMLGAFFILDDPIFNGLAISLLSGVFVSTLLTLVVIPVLYYAYLSGRKPIAE